MDFLSAFLNKNSKEPLYLQLYQYLTNEILAGRIAANEFLPGKRSAAAQLGVSINTIETAYSMLVAEGYVQPLPRKGFQVSPLDIIIEPPAPAQAAPAAPTPKPASWTYNFSSSGVDPALFPRKVWVRLFKEILAEGDTLFTQGPAQGEPALQQAIADYLRGYRGVHCKAQQIQIGAGLELLTAQLARLFPTACIAVENPGYQKNTQILQNEGLHTVQVSIDKSGMQPEKLAHSRASIAYLTPSHQFPTGVVMPVGRRTELLQWAQPNNLIIEDDYDSEFRFEGRPLPSLQGLDRHGRVVYAGTFSRSLSPGLRVAYLVLPDWLRQQWQQQYGDYACTVSRVEQHTLARFMNGGHFARSLNRARASYRQKRDLVITALQKQLAGTPYKIQHIHTGLFFLLQLPKAPVPQIAQQCRASGIRVHAVSEYGRSAATNTTDALIIGYGGLALTSLPAAVQALCTVILQAQNKPPA